MSTRELFGDDSSDEEEEKGTGKETNAPESSPGPSRPPPSRTVVLRDDDDDDDDEDDAVFQDDNNIIGLPADSKKTAAAAVDDPEKPSSGKNSKDVREDEDEEDDEQGTTNTWVVQEFQPPSSQVQLHMTKLPNLVGIQPTAFDPENFDALTEEEYFGQSAYHLIRWRYNQSSKDSAVQQQQRESNTRLVEWEDGSWTLHVGTEAFEVETWQANSSSGQQVKTSFPGLNGYLYLSQKATLRVTPLEGESDEQPAGTVLESVGAVQSRLTVRPSSLQSEAHKSLTIAVRQNAIQRARIAEFMTTEDPERLKQERIKLQSDLDRARGGAAGYSAAGGGRRGVRPRMSRSYLEEGEDDEGYDTTNIRALKRRQYDDMDDYGDDGGMGDDDDEDDDEDATFARPRPTKRQAAAASAAKRDEDDDIFAGDEDDDDEEEMAAPVVKTKKTVSQNVFDDDDDE